MASIRCPFQPISCYGNLAIALIRHRLSNLAACAPARIALPSGGPCDVEPIVPAEWPYRDCESRDAADEPYVAHRIPITKNPYIPQNPVIRTTDVHGRRVDVYA